VLREGVKVEKITEVVETTVEEIIEEEDTRLYFILLQNHLTSRWFFYAFHFKIQMFMLLNELI